MTDDEIYSLRPKCSTCQKELGMIIFEAKGQKGLGKSLKDWLGIKGVKIKKAFCPSCIPEV